MNGEWRIVYVCRTSTENDTEPRPTFLARSFELCGIIQYAAEMIIMCWNMQEYRVFKSGFPDEVACGADLACDLEAEGKNEM